MLNNYTKAQAHPWNWEKINKTSVRLLIIVSMPLFHTLFFFALRSLFRDVFGIIHYDVVCIRAYCHRDSTQFAALYKNLMWTLSTYTQTHTKRLYKHIDFVMQRQFSIYTAQSKRFCPTWAHPTMTSVKILVPTHSKWWLGTHHNSCVQCTCGKYAATTVDIPLARNYYIENGNRRRNCV